MGLGLQELPCEAQLASYRLLMFLCYVPICMHVIFFFFQVAEIISLLDEWPKLPPDHALELLDYAYAEPAVRSYAIECLVHFRLVLKTFLVVQC